MDKYPRLNIYYDAEFTGLRRDTQYISIGMVSESGAFFYAEFRDYDKENVDPWIQEHVIDNLLFNDKEFYQLDNNFTFNDDKGGHHFSIAIKADRSEIKEMLLSWLRNEHLAYYEDGLEDDKIHFYSDCYAYDWVLLNDLICKDGLALNLPSYINYIPIDLSTYMEFNGIDPDINREEYLGDTILGVARSESMFKILPIKNDDVKHNSLWDALVIRYCFAKIALERVPPELRHYKYSTPLPLANGMTHMFDGVSSLPNIFAEEKGGIDK